MFVEYSDQVSVTILGCNIQWRTVVITSRSDVGTSSNQKFCGPSVTLDRRLLQRRETFRGLCVDISTIGYEQLHYRIVSYHGRHVQGCLVVRFDLDADLSALGNEQLNNSRVSPLRGHEQRRFAAGTCQIDRRT